MVNTRYLHVRITNTQYDAIKSKANVAGYKNVSDYVRSRLLQDIPDVLGKLDKLQGSFDETQKLLRRIFNDSGK